jgi:hypothetical protein
MTRQQDVFFFPLAQLGVRSLQARKLIHLSERSPRALHGALLLLGTARGRGPEGKYARERRLSRCTRFLPV